ncbi:MAG: CAP domain-containing protein [Herbinix sp.]|nr:CAP domain-containing protein [Herbinix sp.]
MNTNYNTKNSRPYVNNHTDLPQYGTAPSLNLTITQIPSGTANYAREVLRLVNVERSKAGLPAYTTNQTLTTAANKRAQEITSSFSHTRPNGTSFFTVFRDYKIPFRAAGENIAYGQRTPQAVVSAWMKSPGHRKNILSSRFKKIGIGIAQKSGRNYWSQEFTN